jgi:transcriptional regulator with XRE-family HTH domain
MDKKKKEKELLQSHMGWGLVQILRQAREDRNLTQAVLAAKLGLNQSSIAKVESGQVDLPISRLIEMARVLRLEVVLVPKEKVVAIQALLKPSRRQETPTFKDLLGVEEIG